MTETASIKGSIVASHAEVLQKFLSRSQLGEQQLARFFEPGDLEILSAPIEATRWYDVRMYARLMEFLRDHPGEGSNQFLIDAGRRSAENLIRAGIHQQLEYLHRTQYGHRADPRERFQAFGRDLRLLTSITASILNFAHVSVVEDEEHPLRWVIQYSDATEYPEILCWTTQGFSNRMAEEHGAPGLWYWERPSRELVCFRMNREL